MADRLTSPLEPEWRQPRAQTSAPEPEEMRMLAAFRKAWPEMAEMWTPRGLEQKETVRFRLLVCLSCYHNFHWIEHRLPGHCPECGKLMPPPENHRVIAEDAEATLVSQLKQK